MFDYEHNIQYLPHIVFGVILLTFLFTNIGSTVVCVSHEGSIISTLTAGSSESGGSVFMGIHTTSFVILGTASNVSFVSAIWSVFVSSVSIL